MACPHLRLRTAQGSIDIITRNRACIRPDESHLAAMYCGMAQSQANHPQAVLVNIADRQCSWFLWINSAQCALSITVIEQHQRCGQYHYIVLLVESEALYYECRSHVQPSLPSYRLCLYVKHSAAVPVLPWIALSCRSPGHKVNTCTRVPCCVPMQQLCMLIYRCCCRLCRRLLHQLEGSKAKQEPAIVPSRADVDNNNRKQSDDVLHLG